MENQKNVNSGSVVKKTLYIYLGVCVFLILLILNNSFDSSGNTVTNGMLYTRPNISIGNGQ